MMHATRAVATIGVCVLGYTIAGAEKSCPRSARPNRTCDAMIVRIRAPFTVATIATTAKPCRMLGDAVSKTRESGAEEEAKASTGTATSTTAVVEI